jgi:hypothetical protein
MRTRMEPTRRWVRSIEEDDAHGAGQSCAHGRIAPRGLHDPQGVVQLVQRVGKEVNPNHALHTLQAIVDLADGPVLRCRPARQGGPSPREHSASNDRGQRCGFTAADGRSAVRLPSELAAQVMPSCAKVRIADLHIQFGALDVRRASQR